MQKVWLNTELNANKKLKNFSSISVYLKPKESLQATLHEHNKDGNLNEH